MVLYCAQQLFGRVYGIWKENQLKVDSNELKVNWFQLKSCLINRFLWGLYKSKFNWQWVQLNWKQIDFNWYPFLSIDFFEVEKENQLKVDSNELKVNWF